MVVALSILQLFVLKPDVAPYGLRRAEVKGRAFHLVKPSDGQECGIDGGIAVGIDKEQMVQHIGVPVAVEVEIAVVRHIDDRGCIGGG